MNKNRLNKLWNILSNYASQSKRLTYGELTKKLFDLENYKHMTTMYFDLGKIGEKCVELKIPALNCLVINKRHQFGKGIEIGKHCKVSPEVECDRILDYPGIWKFIQNPFAEENNEQI